MRVTVHKSRDHRAALEIDLAGIRPGKGKHVVRRAERHDFAAANGQCLNHTIAGIHRVDSTAVKNEIWRGGNHPRAAAWLAMASATIAACSAIILAPISG